MVADFLAEATERPAGLCLEGEAGIGKTTLWLRTLERARELGFAVLSARAVHTESVLAYAAVADLLRAIPGDVADGLPEVQRVAIDRVLLRGDDAGPGTDQRVVAAALVSAVEALAERAPVLLAIDDAPWLDTSSRAVLTFAARRFRGRVGLLVTSRPEPGEPDPLSWLRLNRPDAVRRLEVAPLTLGGLHALIAERLNRTFPRPTLVRIAQNSGGNPFYALELARAVDAAPDGDGELPATLAELMRRRIGRLDPEAGTVLLAAACAADPTVELLAEATGNSIGQVLDLLDDVETNGIVVIEGDRVRFTHPLLARSVYTDAGRPDRRRMHCALAGIVTEPELKARHLALAAVSTDTATLRALDAAAEAARRRGAPAAAAEFLELAFRLGGDDPERRVRAAEHHIEAGDADRAVAHLEPTIQRLPAGPPLTKALMLMAGICMFHNRFQHAVDLLERALGSAGDVARLRLRTLLLLAMAYGMAGDFDRAISTAAEAVQLAEELGHPALLSQALALRVHAELQFGQHFDEAGLRRAVELENLNAHCPILFRGHVVEALSMAHIGRLDEAAALLTEARRRCDERGAESDLMAIAGWSTMISVWRGRFDDALAYAEEAVERAEQLGGDTVLLSPRIVRAVVCSYLGRVDEARADARTAYEIAVRCESVRMTEWPLTTLGFVAVSLGDYGEALTVMRPLIAGRITGTGILSTMHVPEAVEAMAAVGRLDEAEALIAELAGGGRHHDRPWPLAIGARCRSIVEAARGDVEAAERTAQHALAEHDRLPMPFERARTELLLGQLQRRLRRKDAAATTLRTALRTFESLGTPLWAHRARIELARTNVGPGAHTELTPSEQRVAELASAGMTNRDVAAALFISPKTVEHNLGRVYRKLGIRSRAELGRLMGGPRTRPADPAADNRETPDSGGAGRR